MKTGTRKLSLLLCLVLVLSGCATNKPANPPLHEPSPGVNQHDERTSPWGRVENGLRCRVTLPESIEQGMGVPVFVELQDDPVRLSPGVRKLNTLMHDAYFTLTLTNPKTGKRFEIKPFGFGGAPPIPITAADLVALDGRRLKPWTVHFPLVRKYTNLAPADYACQVAFSYSNPPPSWVQGAGLNPVSWWKGTVVSGMVHLRVLPETAKFRVLSIPKRLVVTKELTNLRAPGLPAELAAIPVIRFLKADAETVRFRVRNGHYLNTEIEKNGELMEELGSEALAPDWLNPIDQWFDYKGQTKTVDYRIEVFEAAAPGGHLEFSGRGSPGYHLLWSRTFHVSVTGKEFQRLPASVVNVPAGTDNHVCVALIRANPEVEQLSLAKTGITDGSLALVGRLHNLRILYLYDTRVTDVGLVHLHNLTELKTLNLDGTKVTDSGLMRLRRLTHLESLSLRNTAITDKGAAVVSDFPHLKQLDLSYTRIGDATMARLRDLKQVEWLDLTGTRVTKVGLQDLAQLRHLRDLRLPAAVGDEGLKTVSRVLPNCSVEFESGKP